jgi:hypothetical protein
MPHTCCNPAYLVQLLLVQCNTQAGCEHWEVGLGWAQACMMQDPHGQTTLSGGRKGPLHLPWSRYLLITSIVSWMGKEVLTSQASQVTRIMGPQPTFLWICCERSRVGVGYNQCGWGMWSVVASTTWQAIKRKSGGGGVGYSQCGWGVWSVVASATWEANVRKFSGGMI